MAPAQHLHMGGIIDIIPPWYIIYVESLQELRNSVARTKKTMQGQQNYARTIVQSCGNHVHKRDEEKKHPETRVKKTTTVYSFSGDCKKILEQW